MTSYFFTVCPKTAFKLVKSPVLHSRTNRECARSEKNWLVLFSVVIDTRVARSVSEKTGHRCIVDVEIDANVDLINVDLFSASPNWTTLYLEMPKGKAWRTLEDESFDRSVIERHQSSIDRNSMSSDRSKCDRSFDRSLIDWHRSIDIFSVERWLELYHSIDWWSKRLFDRDSFSIDRSIIWSIVRSTYILNRWPRMSTVRYRYRRRPAGGTYSSCTHMQNVRCPVPHSRFQKSPRLTDEPARNCFFPHRRERVRCTGDFSTPRWRCPFIDFTRQIALCHYIF